jgi:hypothetical protein
VSADLDVPDEVLVYGPPGGTLVLTDYPWAAFVAITAAGGASSDGNPGTTQHRRYRAGELCSHLRIHCGAGGRGADGRKGEDGYVIIELYG